jgi:hypothetical protein
MSIEPDQTVGGVTRVEALGYRSLRCIAQTLRPFQVLVGPNASGKSTFLDVIAFFGDLLRAGLDTAVRGDPRLGVPARAPDPKHLAWMRHGGRIELAVELAVPGERRTEVRNGRATVCRYEVAVDVAGSLRLVSESFWLKPADEAKPRPPSLFPAPQAPPETIVRAPRKRAPEGWSKVLGRGDEAERVVFSAETSGWTNPFRLGADRAALASLPEDEERFPVATWARRLLLEGMQRIVLSSEAMRRPSPPVRPRGYLPDGSNLPWVVHALESEHPDRLADWTAHLREALPDLERITTREREEDRHRYVVLRYRSGLEAPSWLVSDGTLRLLALTLLAYLPGLSGIYLVEEPENGIHPRAVETVFQSLSSVYGAQVLLATHSPVILRLAGREHLLCFARASNGATDIVAGDRHPRLTAWKGAVDLGTLFASGVLG